MKHYTTIPSNLLEARTSLEDAYRYYVLALTCVEGNTTNFTLKQLGELTGDNVNTLDKYIQRLPKTVVISTYTYDNPVFTNGVASNLKTRRNRYRFDDTDEYVMITNELFKNTDLSMRAKGLYILISILDSRGLLGVTKSALLKYIKVDNKAIDMLLTELSNSNLITITNKKVYSTGVYIKAPKVVLSKEERKLIARQLGYIKSLLKQFNLSDDNDGLKSLINKLIELNVKNAKKYIALMNAIIKYGWNLKGIKDIRAYMINIGFRANEVTTKDKEIELVMKVSTNMSEKRKKKKEKERINQVLKEISRDNKKFASNDNISGFVRTTEFNPNNKTFKLT